MIEQDSIVRLKKDGKEYILYPATKAENIIGQFDKSKVGLDNVPNVSTDNQTPTFTEASTRANIASGEKLSTLFGKIKKFFTDLKTVAFTGSYTDLSNKPTSMQNPNSLTLTMNGSATNYNGSATASKSWYAPTSGGTAGYNLISNGSGAPVMATTTLCGMQYKWKYSSKKQFPKQILNLLQVCVCLSNLHMHTTQEQKPL